jgi:hypothetical protein
MSIREITSQRFIKSVYVIYILYQYAHMSWHGIQIPETHPYIFRVCYDITFPTTQMRVSNTVLELFDSSLSEYS